MTALTYPFTEQDFDTAHAAWGCNCGPSALAFALQISLDEAGAAIPDFCGKRYTSPTMMKAALVSLGRAFESISRLDDHEALFADSVALVRVQWTGPWTLPGVNPRWAYRKTHWIATWRDADRGSLVFDCNGGIRPFDWWRENIVPALTSMYERSDGGWHPTHIWRLRRAA